MKINTTTLKQLCTLLLIIGLTSCGSRKDLVYFQDQNITPSSKLDFNHELIYAPDDVLTIDISGLDPDAVRPFNLAAVSYSGSIISAQGELKMQTYIIDNDGNIEFPVLGTVKMGGLTRTQATKMLKAKLSDYVKDVIVNIRIANFTITVLGEVNSPGTFTIQDERITLTEALGLANDLSIYGKRDKVFLIREVDGIKQYTNFDLTSVTSINTPQYYLQQNDVIYVEPNNAKVRQSSYNPNNGVIIALVSTLATIAAILID
ncbi:MAG: sugar transporter [Bacteroidetes bacterium MedPE-SWsnd-G2]|nr:MAG: sugar transporter [Bacteroidetes bacterium MedPE-SWsnd-G2]